MLNCFYGSYCLIQSFNYFYTDAVFKNAKDSKEADIIGCIKNWMRHAEARYKNKYKHQI